MGTRVARHRHTESEIAAKLATADEMAGRGVLHRDIAKSLNISLMTYQRWRKARRSSAASMPRAAVDMVRSALPPDYEEIGQISELKIENSRLRRLVANLLLEKLELQECIQGISANGRLIERN
jgi:putative transposase